MDAIKELFINPNYRATERLNPFHGILLFVGWEALFITLTFALWPILSESFSRGQVFISIIAIQLPLLFFCCTFIIATRMSYDDLMLKRLLPSEWGAALLLAFIGFMGAWLILLMVVISEFLLSPEFFDQMMEQAKRMEEAFIPTSAAELAFHLFLLAVIPAIVEELFFRGLLMDAFMRWGPFWAITISSILFGLSHQMTLRIPSLIFVGFLLGILKYRTGKLTASILMHMIYNALLLIMTYFVKGIVDSDMLSLIYRS